MTTAVGEWIWQKGVVKGVSIVVRIVVAWLGAVGLQKWGIEINQDVLILSIVGVLEVLRNLMKTKWPKYFGWL
jgi:hypothetical protein